MTPHPVTPEPQLSRPALRRFVITCSVLSVIVVPLVAWQILLGSYALVPVGIFVLLNALLFGRRLKRMPVELPAVETTDDDGQLSRKATS